MSLIPIEFSILASSDPANGAVNVSPDGSQFTVALQEPFQIPATAVNVQVSAPEGSAWWVSPNIKAGTNNRFNITVGGNDFSVFIPTGLYDLPGLQAALNIQWQGIVAPPLPSGNGALLTLSPDSATQKVVITANYANTVITFAADSPHEILGWDIGGTVPPSNGAVVPFSWIAPNVANFNTINSYQMHSDLVAQGIRVNNAYTQLLTVVPITVAPGSQIVFQNLTAAQIPSPDLRGVRRTNLKFWLTDDKNRPVNTLGEYWTIRVVIKYFMLYVAR